MVWLTKLAARIYRSEAELLSPSAGRERLAKALLFLAVAGFGGAVYGGALLTEFLGRVAVESVEVPVPEASWRILFKESPVGPRGAPAFAEATHPELWGAEVYDRARPTLDRIFERGVREWWLGFVVPPALLKEAAERGAQHLFLGHMRRDFEAYLDGSLAVAGTRVDGDALSFVLTRERLLSGRPLHVALRFEGPDEYPHTLFLNGNLREGFATTATRADLLAREDYAESTRPAVLGWIHLLLALGAAAFWWVSRRPEIFYFSWMNLVSAFVHFRTLELFWLTRPLIEVRHVSFSLRVLEAFSVLMLAMAFSRARKAALALVWALQAGVIAILLSDDYRLLTRIEHSVGEWIAPALFLVGAVFAAIQAGAVLGRGRGRVYHPARGRQLALFATALATIAVLHLYYFSWRTDRLVLTIEFFSYRSLQLVFALIFFAIMAREHRTREAMIRKIPVSRYHRAPVPPEGIRGIVLALDLKGSEAAFRARAEKTGGEDIVAAWRLAVYGAVARAGGTVLYHAGDEVCAFVDGIAELEHALGNYAEELDHLRSECRIRTKPGTEEFPFRFRAAFTFGSIRPIWEEVGEARLPSWVEAGDSTPLVSVHRLLDLEKKVGGREDGSLIVALRADAEKWLASSGNAELIRRERSMESVRIAGKHGVEYEISAFDGEAVGSGLWAPRVSVNSERRGA